MSFNHSRGKKENLEEIVQCYLSSPSFLTRLLLDTLFSVPFYIILYIYTGVYKRVLKPKGFPNMHFCNLKLTCFCLDTGGAFVCSADDNFLDTIAYGDIFLSWIGGNMIVCTRYRLRSYYYSIVVLFDGFRNIYI